jgi:hypothetical protein
MNDPMEVMGRLDSQALELDKLSKDLADVERRLEPAEIAYEEFMAAFEEGLWEAHVTDGAKFPPEKLRERMGRHAMDPELLGRYTLLINSRRRLKDRIGSVKVGVEAQRSILSALKVEMEASGAALRRVA